MRRLHETLPDRTHLSEAHTQFTEYGFTGTAYAFAAAIGPVIMGKAFDATGSYTSLLTILAAVTLIAAASMLLLPRYPVRSTIIQE